MTESAPTQANREISIQCEGLDEDVLLFRRMRGTEAINQLFEYEVEVLSTRSDISADELLGKNVTIRMTTRGDDDRYWNGIVATTEIVPPLGNLHRYVLVLRPWLWLLTQTANSQIFQKDIDDIQKTPDIILKIFQDRGFSDYNFDALGANYREWEYVVQYRETDFNFVSRLMEHEGISYHFLHENGRHTLILKDPDSAPEPFHADYAEVMYYPESEGGIRETDHLSQWTCKSALLTGAYAINSRNFLNPQTSLHRQATAERTHDHPDLEYYVPEGGYFTSEDGERYVQIRIDEISVRQQVAFGGGNVRGMAAGSSFTLDGYPRDDQNIEYRILKVEHTLTSNTYESIPSGDETSYSCSIEAIDAQKTYRPPRVTPKPEITGPLTATVSGPEDADITVDEHGRVPVRFHWDRSDRFDATSSCYIRVSQGQAGKNYGAMYIPRRNEEVIVEFIEGDPDMPIITGRVYNADNPPPLELPDNKNSATYKSLSTPDGEGFNELRFTDTKDEEMIYIHAQKDIDLLVLNDRTERVENNRDLTVVNDKRETVENNSHQTVGNDLVQKVGKDKHVHVEGKKVTKVDGEMSYTVTENVDEVFEADHTEEVTGDYYLKAENIVIEALTKLTIKIGDSYFVIDDGGLTLSTPSDIAVSGDNVETEASSNASMVAGSTATVEGSTAELTGSSEANIQGGTVNIN